MKILLVAVGAALVGAATLSSARAERAQTRVLDRTVLCETGLSGGIREIDVSARSTSGSGPRSGGYVDVATSGLPTPRLAGVFESAVELSPACRSSRVAVPLVRGNLVGGVVARTIEAVDCQTPRRVLVRVRAEFRARTTLRRHTRYGYPMLTARGVVTSGSLAARTPSGAPLVFARLLPTGRVQVFTAIPVRCIPD